MKAPPEGTLKKENSLFVKSIHCNSLSMQESTSTLMAFRDCVKYPNGYLGFYYNTPQ